LIAITLTVRILLSAKGIASATFDFIIVGLFLTSLLAWGGGIRLVVYEVFALGMVRRRLGRGPGVVVSVRVKPLVAA
jgi:hypothetical protein